MNISHISEIRNVIGKYFTRTYIWLCILSIVGFFYRAYPHLFIIPRWIAEEDSFSYTVFELIRTGTTVRIGYQAIIEQYLIYYVYLVTHINPITLLQYANPFIGGLTVIPVYYCMKQLLTKKEAFIATTIWTFGENVIYRSSTFNSTETLGFFFAMLALYMYLNIKNKTLRKDKIKFFFGFLVIITVSIFTHLLPATLIIGIVSLDMFLKGNKRNKIIVSLFVCLVIIFLYSPLNPDQTMMYSIRPDLLISQFNLSNILSLYSISDLMLGVSIFFGSVVLIFLSLPEILSFKYKNKFMYIYLFGCLILFIASWLIYSSYLIGPTRVVFYFIIPFAYFTSIFISKFKGKILVIFVFIIIITTILTSLNGINTMLFIDKSLTLDEYTFLEKSTIIQNTTYFDNWWTDTVFRDSLLISLNNINSTKPSSLPNIYNSIDVEKLRLNINATLSTITITTYENGTIITKNNPPIFKYVLLSPRMEKSAFFLVNTKYRTIQINQPIPDIWKDLPDWKLIEEYKNIKVYKWIGTDIEG
jgi:hypothetical protein